MGGAVVTTVAALVEGGSCWMACDSLTVDGWEMKGSIGSKIVRLEVGREQALLGVSGDAQLIPMLRHGLKLEAPDPGDDVGCDSWAYRVACAVTELCVEARPPVMNEDGRSQRGAVLLAAAGRLWSCATNQAWRVGSYFAIGSGDNYAMGAFHALDAVGELGPGRLHEVIEAACAFDLHSGLPVMVESLT